MNKFRIRRTSSDYIGAINKTTYANLNISSTYKKMLHDHNNTNIDLTSLFMEERENCHNYRVILSVKPYCSNILFNPCTEITYTNDNGELCSVNDIYTASCKDAIGKHNGLTARDMIKNTEYSSENFGFAYYPGLDIFNNHIIRNKSYRIVNRLDKNKKDRNYFNTIRDYFRLQDGTRLKKCNRLDVSDTTMSDKHLYNADDILSFKNGDAVKENLREENGWFGFYNTSVIEAKNENGETLDISRVINNKGNCQFVDMYPDRTLFSFTPQYNSFRNRVENNWEIVLTYPFEHTTQNGPNDIHVVESNGQNGLFIVDAEMYHTPSGSIGVMFRTLTKHNLHAGDIVHMFFNENTDSSSEGSWNRIDNDFSVYSIGDKSGNNTDYYFTIDNVDLLEAVFCTPKQGETYTSWDYIRDYFYKAFDKNDVEVVSSDSQYVYNLNELVRKSSDSGDIYICTEKKVNEDENLITNIGTVDDNVFNKYFTLLTNVCNVYSDDDNTGLSNFPTVYDCYIMVGNRYYALYNHDSNVSFIERSHKMSASDFIIYTVNSAFRIENDDEIPTDNKTSLWNDYISFRMVKVVGGIECDYYVRKFKPLPGIYQNERYKLAFATTIYGDDVSQMTFTDTINIDGLKDNRGRDLSEIFATVVKTNKGYKEWYVDMVYNNINIEKSHCFGPVTCGFDYYSNSNDNLNIKNKRKGDYDVRFLYNTISNIPTDNVSINFCDHFITENDEWYYGDIVEFSPYTYEETVLCDANFRFNTAQRELSNPKVYTFEYDEIVSDDYDSVFDVQTTSLPNAVIKHEGYYYKPHYKLRLRALSTLKQDNHRQIFVSSAEPYQSNGMYVKINTKTRHRLIAGDKLVMTDVVNDIDWYLTVAYTLNNYSAIVTIIDKDDSNYQSWIKMCLGLNSGNYVLKKFNENIPEYASRIGTGTYVWRDTVGLWEENEETSLVYANNALYIDDSINFYLKRQNNDRNINELVDLTGVADDIEGLKTDEHSTYDYIKEKDNIC